MYISFGKDEEGFEKCICIVEAYHSKSKQCIDFLIDIGEPLSRPKLVHEYELT